MTQPISLRTYIRLADLQAIIDLHGTIYAKECGWNASLNAYAAGPLIDWLRNTSSRNRIWLAEKEGKLVGCVAIVANSEDTVHLRFLLVDPSARRRGLGKRLLDGAIAFAKEQSFAKIILWTERSLKAAASLYAQAGFVKTEGKPD